MKIEFVGEKLNYGRANNGEKERSKVEKTKLKTTIYTRSFEEAIIHFYLLQAPSLINIKNYESAKIIKAH